jgi:hypothetical protein
MCTALILEGQMCPGLVGRTTYWLPVLYGHCDQCCMVVPFMCNAPLMFMYPTKLMLLMLFVLMFVLVAVTPVQKHPGEHCWHACTDSSR